MGRAKPIQQRYTLESIFSIVKSTSWASPAHARPRPFLDAQKWPWTQKRAPVGLRAPFWRASLTWAKKRPRSPTAAAVNPVTGSAQPPIAGTTGRATAAKTSCSNRLMGTQKQLHRQNQILCSAFALAFALAYAYVSKIPLEAF